jgi:hypothetical protein
LVIIDRKCPAYQGGIFRKTYVAYRNKNTEFYKVDIRSLPV